MSNKVNFSVTVETEGETSDLDSQSSLDQLNLSDGFDGVADQGTYEQIRSADGYDTTHNFTTDQGNVTEVVGIIEDASTFKVDDEPEVHGNDISITVVPK